MLNIQKAETKIGYLKVGVYGQSGSGKTYTSLLFATELAKRLKTKVLVFDTEHGTDFYKDFGFDVVYTRDINDLIEFFKSEDYKDYGVVVIDSLTHFWDEIQDKYLESLVNSNNTKKRERGLSGELQFQDWRFIKKPYKKFMQLMLSSPKHVFFTTREGVDYKMENGELVVVGQKMRAEKETQYEPSIVIRMMLHNLQNVAVVEKDRSGTIQGKMFKNPTFEILEPVLTKLGVHDVSVKEMNEVETADIDFLQKLDGLIKEYAKKYNKTIEAVITSLIRSYNVESIDELDEKQLSEIYEKMRKAVGKNE